MCITKSVKVVIVEDEPIFIVVCPLCRKGYMIEHKVLRSMILDSPNNKMDIPTFDGDASYTLSLEACAAGGCLNCPNAILRLDVVH
jgi:hypothetical protein